jgi:quinoprotein glucose dehydrogenase
MRDKEQIFRDAHQARLALRRDHLFWSDALFDKPKAQAVLLAVSFIAFALSASTASAQAKHHTSLQAAGSSWAAYDGDPAGDHYSTLTQINKSNVGRLHVAWTFDTHQTAKGLETNPLIVGRTLYGYAGSGRIIALDAANGTLLWEFKSGVEGSQPVRGLSWWTDGKQSRLLVGLQYYLYALDPKTGNPIPAFGEGGRVDLRKGLGTNYLLQSVALTSPGIVYKDLIIVGGRMPESHPAPHGDIRAYNVFTGKLAWTFNTIPQPGDFGSDTWPKNYFGGAGAANNWAGMALDSRRGIVYVPTGSAVFDMYGADRIGNDLFADTLLALDANTGKRIWHFQGVHHDIWDRDFPSPPALLTVTRDGKSVDAIAQTTKQGFLFLFNRANGKPLFPIEEKPYPASDVPGEVASPTQPTPLLPAPFTRQRVTEGLLTDRTPEAHAWAVKEFSQVRSTGQFTPLGLDKATVIFPGTLGGAEWGGPAVDPKHAILYVNANELVATQGLTKVKPGGTAGERIYRNQCALCHGNDRAGSLPYYPPLTNVGKLLTRDQINETIHQGRGRMPAFPNIQGGTLDALLRYLIEPPLPEGKRDPDVDAVYSSTAEGTPMAYQVTGDKDFVDPEGYPAIKPPWGTLSAIDLNSGKYLWHIPLGEYPALVAKGIAPTGTENYGGPIVTASGMVFIGATAYDNKFRCFDSATGALLWQAVLPFAGAATPATYMVDGKQYIVIAAGGVSWTNTPVGGMYVAFSLQ